MLWDTINMLPESLMFNGCTEILGNFRKPESWNLQIWVDPWIHMSCSPHLHPTPVASPSPGRLLESQIPGPTPDPRNQIRWRWSPAMCVSTSPLVASKCENHCYKSCLPPWAKLRAGEGLWLAQGQVAHEGRAPNPQSRPPVQGQI